MNEKNILIIGDSCIDKFVYGDVSRLAPEGPAPVFTPSYEKINDGMAANVYNNIIAIGAKCNLITQSKKIFKTRYVDIRTNYLIMRLDEENDSKQIDQKIINSIVKNTYRNFYYDAIVISDYCKGFLKEADIEKICNNNKNVFLDTKKILGPWCKNASYIKINQTEYERTQHTLANLLINDKLIITYSEKGCKYKNQTFSIEKVDVKDLSGAGDTFLAGLVCEFVKTNNIINSIKFAQECATIVVQKKGVCTI